ncbi:Alanine racemase, N-terminal domain [Dethiosulfatibacter aminovorans DSM 17477]|uniref:Alanine racemase, N-terminal domain n=1 Tax=Dethiosulfatibacter aminovorans DSM 17477 TaxID=1121476 RepID=A0A1M6M0E7_9FIRM|nr:alanine racemase [Dethiosulfatibacter aminovorans]SHJ76925.1 Alanine racemase, N-terminal domain [Dethiosulfatibacter aminovorans DSM 17477]
MNLQQDRTWMEVNLDILRENYDTIRNGIKKNSDIMVMLKANAYGLGAIPIARELESIGCQRFGVACFEEAMELRDAGIQTPILIVGMLQQQQVPVAIKQNFSVTVSDLAAAEKYSRLAEAAGGKLHTYIKVDVGMSRFGIVLDEHMEEAVGEVIEMYRLQILFGMVL